MYLGMFLCALALSVLTSELADVSLLAGVLSRAAIPITFLVYLVYESL